MASVGPSAASTQPALPSGPAVFKTIPYAFILPEIVSMPGSAASRHPLLAKTPQNHPEGTMNALPLPLRKGHLVFELVLNAQRVFLMGILGAA